MPAREGAAPHRAWLRQSILRAASRFCARLCPANLLDRRSERRRGSDRLNRPASEKAASYRLRVLKKTGEAAMCSLLVSGIGGSRPWAGGFGSHEALALDAFHSGMRKWLPAGAPAIL